MGESHVREAVQFERDLRAPVALGIRLERPDPGLGCDGTGEGGQQVTEIGARMHDVTIAAMAGDDIDGSRLVNLSRHDHPASRSL